MTAFAPRTSAAEFRGIQRAVQQPQVSVVICAHNAAPRIDETLVALAAQHGLDGVSWEILLVNNASTDGTGAGAAAAWARLQGDPRRLRIVEEPRPGLLHARQRALQEARAGLICFVDDDNSLAPDYLARAVAVMSTHPHVAAVGGACSAPPAERPEWFSRLSQCYAVGEQHPEAGDVTGHTFPLWGAGLTVRVAALEALQRIGFSPALTGRAGKQALSGDDTEICLALRRAGWRLYYDPNLRLIHRIDPARLTWTRCLRQHEGFGAAAPLLDLYRYVQPGGPAPALRWAAALAREVRPRLRRAGRPGPEAPDNPDQQDRQLAAAWSRGRWRFLTRRWRFYLRHAATLQRLDWPAACPESVSPAE